MTVDLEIMIMFAKEHEENISKLIEKLDELETENFNLEQRLAAVSNGKRALISIIEEKSAEIRDLTREVNSKNVGFTKKKTRWEESTENVSTSSRLRRLIKTFSGCFS